MKVCTICTFFLLGMCTTTIAFATPVFGIVPLGFDDSEHTRNDGYKESYPHQLNEAGQVRGYSKRYNGSSTLLGRTAWLYDAGTTIDIGLTGAEHTRSSGYKFSSATQLNEAGQVGGYSLRYNGGTGLGQDAWLYDPALDQTFSMQLSTRSDGYAYSSIHYLGEDGLVLGSYEVFDTLDNSLGENAFYFTVADGLHDLGALVNGGLAANGWDFLASAHDENGLRQIIGYGKLTSQSDGQMAYLMTPAVPEPASLGLLTMACVLVLVQRRAT